MSGIKPSFIASVVLETKRVRRRCTHIAQGMMRKKRREKLKGQKILYHEEFKRFS